MAKQKGYVAITEEAKSEYFIKQEFKGEVFDKEVRFPKELGAEHPFPFEDAEKLWKRFGLVSGIINKLTDLVVGDFTVKLDNKNSQALIDDFVHNTNFSTVIRAWIREGFLKGNGFIELDLKNTRIRVMNANQMYVKRNRKGKVLKYNQYLGDLKRFSINSNKLNPFEPDQIAHLAINKLPNDPYGIGIIWPNERVIDNLIKGEQDKSKLMDRKAGAPVHVKIGVPGEQIDNAVIDDMANKLKYINNRTEWVTDGNVQMDVIQFGEIGKNVTDSIMHDFRMLLAGTEMPEVLMGSGQLNEGIAKTQLDGLKLKIKSIREQVENIIEEKIIRPLLRNNSPKLDEQPEFIWNLPTEEEINERITKIQLLLGTMGISENMKRQLQIELARIMGFEDLIEMLAQPEMGLDEQVFETQRQQAEAEAEAAIKQPEVPGAKPRAKQSLVPQITETTKNVVQEKPHEEMTIREFINIKEMPGFNYSDYLMRILQALKRDQFDTLRASNDDEIELGLLPEKDIKKLKIILKDGFRKNQTISEIEKDIKENVPLRDRVRDGKIILSASARPTNIARTETVRLANMGLVDLYKDNGIKEVRFLAALSDRTCPICEALNGRVFKLNELSIGGNQPPLHSNCRCSLVSLNE